MSDRDERERYRRRLAGDRNAVRPMPLAHRYLWITSQPLAFTFVDPGPDIWKNHFRGWLRATWSPTERMAGGIGVLVPTPWVMEMRGGGYRTSPARHPRGVPLDIMSFFDPSLGNEFIDDANPEEPSQ